MKKLFFALFLLFSVLLSGCSRETVSYDAGSKDINEVIDSDIYKNIDSSMKISDVSTLLGGYNNYFEKDHEVKIYEFYLKDGILEAVIEPSDDTWHTSYSFKPYNLQLNNFFKVSTEFIDNDKKWIYIKQNKKTKVIIILSGERIDKILLY